MGKSFVRDSFYHQPPSRGASQEEWADWLQKDELAARAAKVKFNRNNRMQSIENTPDLNVMKIGGIYKQVPSLGFVGGEDGVIGKLEPIVEANQEKCVDQVKQSLNAIHRRGGSHKYRNKAKRERIRLERKAKYRGR